MSRRDELLAQLRSKSFDLLIIGGGIVGAGIARDAAMRGLSVALIEQGDFAGGTSSKTSKLIHGGLRYLEHGHLRLVRESLQERHVLRSIAPSLVQPLPLLLPLYADDTRSPWKIRLGLWLYDLLAIGRNVRTHRMLSVRKALAAEPRLAVNGLRAAGVFADCRMDDARLCLANVLQAVQFGAACVNYVRLREFSRTAGRLCGAVAEDLHSGGTIEIHAARIINATGPWSDAVRRLSDSTAVPRLALTKGIHLVVPRLASRALFVEARRDRRMLFLVPWGAYTLLGTTESPVREPLERLIAGADEVQYLLDEANRVLPDARVGPEDVISTFAGARPLLAFAGQATRASREHQIELDGQGLVSVMGGKFTTYRRMAQQTVDLVVRLQQWRVDRCLTDQVGLLEAVSPVTLEHWQGLTRFVAPEVLARFLVRYGAGTADLLRLIAEDPTLAQPVCPHHDEIQAELVYGWQHELACTMTDLLARRTPIAWSSCQGLDALSRLKELAERYSGLDDAAISRDVEAYKAFLAQATAFRATDPTPSSCRVVPEASRDAGR